MRCGADCCGTSLAGRAEMPTVLLLLEQMAVPVRWMMCVCVCVCVCVSAVLQFVPGHVDVRVCSFSEQVERGLLTAYAEVRRRYQENGNFTIEVTMTTLTLTW